MRDVSRGSPAVRLILFTAALAALHGALLLLAFPPLKFWWLTPLIVTPLVIAARLIAAPAHAAHRLARWSALAAVFVVALAPWLWLGRWIQDVSEAGWPAFSILMASWPTLFVAILARVWRRGASCDARTAPIVAALIWTGIESFRAHIFLDGYPWYLLAHPLIDALWLSQSAEIWGVTPISFLCAVTGAMVAHLLAQRWSGGDFSWKGPTLTLSAVWLLLALGGAIRLAWLPFAPGPVIGIVQTNLPSSNKVRWTPEQQVADFTRFRDATIEALKHARTTGVQPLVMIWPETMLPGFGLEPDTITLQRNLRSFPADLFSSQITALVEASGVPMLVGSSAFEGLREEGDRWRWHRRFNSVYLVQDEPPFARYDKLQLTPFGETMPYIRASPWLQSMLLDLGARGFTFDLDEGTEPVVFTLSDGTRAVTPICFEDTLPGLCRHLVDGPDGKRADLIINLSNDGWFGHADEGRAAHELAARWRAIETRVGVVRVANTGLTSIVDPAGRVLERLPVRELGWLIAPTTICSTRTIFARVGDVGSWLAMIATALILLRTFLRRPRGSVAVMLVSVLVIALPSCSNKPPGRSPGPTLEASTGPPSPLGLDTPPSQQSWSTRDISVAPEETRAAASDGPARTVAPGLPVVSSGDIVQTSIELLQFAARSRYPILAANAIEELTVDPEALRAVIRPSLVSPNRGVRFVATMAVGKAGLEEMATLIQPLLMDQSESVRAAAIYTLSKLGQPVDLSPLAEMIRSDDPEIRGNAIMILGDLGNPSAVPLLRSTIGLGMTRVDPARRRITDLQLAEALAKLGEDSELEPIRAALFAPAEQAELIALACQMVARIKDGGSVATLKAVAYAGGTATRPPEIRLLAFVSLADLGSSDPTICADFARRYLTDRNPQLRSLAVRAMAGCGGESALPQVEARLYDSNPVVQIAAAGAILRLASTGQLLTSR